MSLICSAHPWLQQPGELPQGGSKWLLSKGAEAGLAGAREGSGQAVLPPEQPARSWPQLPQSRDAKEVRQESGHGLLLLHTARSGSSPVSEGAQVAGDSEPLVPGPPHTTCPEGHISSSVPKPALALSSDRDRLWDRLRPQTRASSDTQATTSNPIPNQMCSSRNTS